MLTITCVRHRNGRILMDRNGGLFVSKSVLIATQHSRYSRMDGLTHTSVEDGT
jgi:hypothetical protein